jgi:hypothetical protein
MSDNNTGSRLPPPAFPPGSRKHVHRNPEPAAEGDLSDGFISPDEPIPARQGSVDDAFISPDDPMPERHDELADALISPDDPIGEVAVEAAYETEEEDAFEGVVTGMGHDAHMEPEELALSMGGDPHVVELVEMVSKLAAALRAKGEGGLRTTPDMSRFEATLRSYCVGYLAGRQAEDEAPVEF